MATFKFRLHLPVIISKHLGNFSAYISRRDAIGLLQIKTKTGMVHVGHFFSQEMFFDKDKFTNLFLNRKGDEYKIIGAKDIQTIHSSRLQILSDIFNTTFLEVPEFASTSSRIFKRTRAILNDINTEVSWEGKSLSPAAYRQFQTFRYGGQIVKIAGITESNFRRIIKVKDMKELDHTELLIKAKTVGNLNGNYIHNFGNPFYMFERV